MISLQSRRLLVVNVSKFKKTISVFEVIVKLKLMFSRSKLFHAKFYASDPEKSDVPLCSDLYPVHSPHSNYMALLPSPTGYGGS